MTTTTSLLAACFTLLFVSGGQALAAGPISPLYLTAGVQGSNWVIQGSSAIQYLQQHPDNFGEYPIAVGTTVRTLHCLQDSPGFGSEYTLNGAYTGVDYAGLGSITGFYDGTRDASHNYSVDYRDGKVYRMGLDWSNPVMLFDTGFGAYNALGITYDPANNSLWVSQWTSGTVVDFSLNGSSLTSFSTPFASITCLALDHADNTLWMGTQGQQGTFYQYSRIGTNLGSQVYPDLVSQNTLGGEFAFAAPEPSTVALLAAGAAGLAMLTWRRKRRQAA
jgi:hypothetical protein